MTSSADGLKLSVIIPFHDKGAMTLACVRSLQEQGPVLDEILLVSNNSTAEELNLVNCGIVSHANCRVLEYNHPFNYQALNNWAARLATGGYLLFLNNDTELTRESAGVLEHMTELAARPEIGMVGCTLLYADGRTIQHAGVHLTPRGLADHIYVGRVYKKAVAPNRNRTIFPYDITSDLRVTAVTGAAQLIETGKFWSVDGFNEHFTVCGGDVDLCIRLNLKGYQTMLAGGGYIIHKESQSRASKPIPYTDFYWSYLSYIKGFSSKDGDPFVPLITQGRS